MVKEKKDKRLLVVLGVLVSALLVWNFLTPQVQVSVVESTGTITDSGFSSGAFSITPLSLEFIGSPSDVVVKQLTIKNNLERESKVSFITSSGAVSVFPSELVLAPGAKHSFNVSVSLPIISGEYEGLIKVYRDETGVFVGNVRVKLYSEEVNFWERFKAFIGL